MKKVLLFATAGLLLTGAVFAANNDKGKKKKCAKGKSCCSQKKACSKKKAENSVPM